MVAPMSEDATRPDLLKLLAYWQPALGLRDWVIRVEYDRALDVMGRSTVWWRDREARVRICEPAQIVREWPPCDVELTFVHELVHCVVDPLYHLSMKDLPEEVREQPVEQLAKSYVRLHRVYPLADDWLNPKPALEVRSDLGAGPPIVVSSAVPIPTGKKAKSR